MTGTGTAGTAEYPGTVGERGIGPWLEFGDVEDQLRVVKPRAVRKHVAPAMVPFYALLAQEHGYRTEAVRGISSVRLVLVRQP